MQKSGIMSGPQTGTRTGPTDTQRTSGRFNRLAIWSLVLSILTLGGIGSIVGSWLGLRARTRIDQSAERGRGLAIAGIIVGVISYAARPATGRSEMRARAGLLLSLRLIAVVHPQVC